MKKVRFLVGSAGAVPVLGLMMPAAGAAAMHPAQPGQARPGAKTVSLRHSAAGPAGARLAVLPDNSGCAGHTYVHRKADSVSTKFWYTNAVHNSAACVGTVEGTWSSIVQDTVIRFRTRVWSGTGTHKRLAFSNVRGATLVNARTLHASVGVHDWFGYTRGLPVQVCTAWLSSNYGVEAGPQCASVR